MKITFLGTNGWYGTKLGDSTCVFVETASEYLILDAGSGFYKTEKLIKKKTKPVYLFLSHLHLDHIEGLQVLSRFDLPQGITIMVGRGMAAELESFFRPPFLPTIENHKTKIRIIEEDKFGSLSLKTFTLPLEHIVPTTGLRFENEGKILTYALDTGMCDNLISLAQGADLLITESAFLAGEKPNNNHMNPQEAAEAALKAGAKKLAIIHFKADVYLKKKDREIALEAARAIFPQTIAPSDGAKEIV
jgi:ribonuclease BN (tRNA processing enzyme)